GLITLGLLVTLAGIFGNAPLALMVGPCLLALGIALVLSRVEGLVVQGFVSPRLAFTLGAVFVLAWLFNPYFLANLGGQTLDYLSRVIVSGLLAVAAGVLLVTFNAASLVGGLLGLVGRWPRTALILKTALAYPLGRRFRLASTLAMFALVIFLTTVIASLLAIQNSLLASNIEKQEGGYQIAADVNPFVVPTDPSAALRQAQGGSSGQALAARILADPDLADKIAAVSLVSSVRLSVQVNDGEQLYFTALRGVDEAFIEENEYTFQRMAAEYSSAREVWRAVRDDPSLVVVDGSVLPPVGVGGPVEEEQEKAQLGGLYQLPGVSLMRADVGDTL
ncbi:MAG: hypothetical protein C0405_15395, partial [Desulfovibrio sp.]|nr:hypothetical protein [Desulfovibrio sp.]